MLIFFTSRHYYFFEKLKIVEKQLCKLNCSYGKVSHAINSTEFFSGCSSKVLKQALKLNECTINLKSSIIAFSSPEPSK